MAVTHPRIASAAECESSGSATSLRRGGARAQRLPRLRSNRTGSHFSDDIYVTPVPGDERYPTFSPDGTQIAFRHGDDLIEPSGDEEVFVMTGDGTSTS